MDIANIPFISDTVSKYLWIADQIAAVANNCARGDDYSPGNFSKIIVEKDYIILYQVNHMNAKSLDHRNNYSLRNLEFYIPIGTQLNTGILIDYAIGAMQIKFSDNSSANLKVCGDKIKHAIADAMKRFE